MILSISHSQVCINTGDHFLFKIQDYETIGYWYRLKKALSCLPTTAQKASIGRNHPHPQISLSKMKAICSQKHNGFLLNWFSIIFTEKSLSYSSPKVTVVLPRVPLLCLSSIKYLDCINMPLLSDKMNVTVWAVNTTQLQCHTKLKKAGIRQRRAVFFEDMNK